MDVYVDGRRIPLDPSGLIGKGGEAEVYAFGPDAVLKVFKTPDHPDLHGQKAEQAAARARLDEHQHKLRAFPTGLPGEVVTPERLATDRKGKAVVGYAMRRIHHAEPVLRLSDPVFRRAFGGNEVRDVFLRLHSAVDGLHHRGVVIGDFNDLNVLFGAGQLALIDADSYQFGAWQSRVFTERFLDPLHMAKSQPVLARPYSQSADWFAFAALLMQSLLLVGPWGGIHRPAQGKRLSPAQRPLHRIWSLHPEVQYPKPARPPASLPDSLLHLLSQTFEKDARIPIPDAELRALSFTTCKGCGLEHARAACPLCRPSATAALQPALSVRGSVTATTLFATEGVILTAAIRQGALRVVVHDRNAYRDERGTELLTAPLSAEDRFLVGQRGWHLRRGVATRLDSGERLSAEALATDGQRVFWSSAGALLREGALGPERVGQVIEGRTWFGVGPRFGAGFYRAGNCSVLFTFTEGGLREDAQALRLSSDPLQVRFAFSDTHCWILITARSGERQLLVIDSSGAVLGRSPSTPDWLEALQADPIAVGPWLFVPSDRGVLRIDLQTGAPVVTREFPDTEPFVDAATPLLFDGSGLVAVHPRRILKLQMQ